MALELDSRKQKILKAIIEEYTRTGEPVGSKRISALLDIVASPATIRNDMAILFEMGLLEQPHTSAGRVPSHMGYRYYIDHLMQPSPISPNEIAAMQAMFNVWDPDPDKLLADAAQALADYTHCAAISSTSTPPQVCVRRIELIPAGERTVIIMVIASNGAVKSKVCRVNFSVNQEICKFFTSFANARLAQRSLNEISSSYINSVAYSFGDYSEVFTTLLSAIYSLCKEINDGQFCAKGVTNLLGYEEHRDYSRDLLVMLGEKQRAIELIPQGNFDLTVSVGKENSSMELSNSTVVAVRYNIGASRCGTLALIGPVRMEYPKLIPHMQFFAKMLSELLSEAMNEQPNE